MAEKAEKLLTREEKIAEAKELFSRGSRNYVLRCYRDASDDLSQACEMFGAVYGENADELGMPYLIYAKSLVALAQNENKVIDVPDVEDEADDENEEAVNDEENSEEDKKENESNSDEKDKEKEKDEEAQDIEMNGDTNEDQEEEEEKVDESKNTNGAASSNEPGASNGPKDETEAAEEDDDVNKEEDEPVDLMVAWEVLELAAKIFERQGEPQLSNLAEVYAELAGISIENSNFEEAIYDYKRALEIQIKLPEDNRRIIAEIHYKIGLAYMMLKEFDKCVKEMQAASELIDQEIQEEKIKDDNKTEKTKELIKDLEEAKQDILAKIAEIEETKQQSIDEIKRELSNVLNIHGTSSTTDGAGPSSSAQNSVEKPKATDISHLVKRKKPEGTDVESSPAKKAAL